MELISFFGCYLKPHMSFAFKTNIERTSAFKIILLMGILLKNLRSYDIDAFHMFSTNDDINVSFIDRDALTSLSLCSKKQTGRYG